MTKLEIHLKTLTPLWTGGADGRCDRIHETGIIGSLRWWYETIVRGLGGEACDPSQHQCGYAPDKPHQGLCDVCRVFGATGWQRRFRLEVSTQDELAWAENTSLNLKPYGRDRGWFFNPGRVGSVSITITGDDGVLAELSALFRFLETWGHLGARPQLGYGLFQITEPSGRPGAFHWEAKGNPQVGALPDLRTFTFFKLNFSPREENWWAQVSGIRELRSRRGSWNVLERLAAQGMVPVVPALKNHLRFGQTWSSTALPHWLFGTLRRDTRVRSKVGLSWAYHLNETEWEIRGWVYLPQDATGQRARSEITRTLKRALEHPSTWFKAMGVAAGHRYPARVTFEPALRPWQLHTPDQVADFMEAAR